jgi:hypothetical protein
LTSFALNKNRIARLAPEEYCTQSCVLLTLLGSRTRPPNNLSQVLSVSNRVGIHPTNATRSGGKALRCGFAEPEESIPVTIKNITTSSVHWVNVVLRVCSQPRLSDCRTRANVITTWPKVPKIPGMMRIKFCAARTG